MLVAYEHEDLHYFLAKHIDGGRTRWTKRGFNDDDLKTLGREEVDHIVDAVFVTHIQLPSYRYCP